MFEADRFDVFPDDDDEDCGDSQCQRCNPYTGQLRLTVRDGELVPEGDDDGELVIKGPIEDGLAGFTPRGYFRPDGTVARFGDKHV